MRWLKRIGRYVTEIVMAVGGIWALSTKLMTWNLTDRIGAAFFFGGVIYTVNRLKAASETTLTKLADAKDSIDRLKERVGALHSEQSHAYVEEVLGSIDRGAEPHVYAGHSTARGIYSYANGITDDLKRLSERQVTQVHIDERYVINQLLAMVAGALPDEAIWLGITHLTDGWQSAAADPGFEEFVSTVRDRAKEQSLQVLRLYASDSPDHIRSIEKHLRGELKAGIGVRTLVHTPLPPDISLLWKPPTEPITLKGAESPVETLRRHNVNPICGMDFKARNLVSLDVVTVYLPEAANFQYLRQQFDKFWNMGNAFS